APAGSCEHVPHLRILGIDTGNPGVRDLASASDRAIRTVFGADPDDPRGVASQHRHISLVQEDAPPFGKPLVRSGSGTRGQDHDALAYAASGALHLLRETGPEGEQYDHRDGTPGDSEDGQNAA